MKIFNLYRTLASTLGCASVAVALSAANAASPNSDTAASGAYSVVRTIPLGSVTKWDFAAVDELHHHLFVSRGEYSEVLDSTSGSKVGEIRPTPGVHGFAFAPELNLGFISAGHSDTIIVVDLTTLAVKKAIPSTGSNPDSIVYDSASKKVFVMNGHSKSITVIDAKTLTVSSTVQTNGKPEFAVADGSGRIFVNLEESAGAVQVIDAASEKMISTWPLPGCKGPTGLAIDPSHHRLFSVCVNRVMAITDSDTGKPVAHVAIGDDPDAALFDPATQNIFSSNGGSGTLTVVHEDAPDQFTVLAEVPTEKRAKTMAYDSNSQQLYLPADRNNEFTLLVVKKN